jgi:hypothetical protein
MLSNLSRVPSAPCLLYLAAEARAAHAEAALEAAQAETSQNDGGADGPPATPDDQQR